MLPTTFTFHYASTLSVYRYRGGIQSKKFTFHYASTLSDAIMARIDTQTRFTFHYASTLSRPHPRTAGNTLYLHSTMLLLYPCCDVATERRILIYIPLCFYFILSAPAQWKLCFLIYIPLCFYFIVIDHRDLHRVLLFTFHYASTLSFPVYEQNRQHTVFTFHYASTLSNPGSYQGQVNPNLHSTMLLLYRSAR